MSYYQISRQLQKFVLIFSRNFSQLTIWMVFAQNPNYSPVQVLPNVAKFPFSQILKELYLFTTNNKNLSFSNNAIFYLDLFPPILIVFFNQEIYWFYDVFNPFFSTINITRENTQHQPPLPKEFFLGFVWIIPMTERVIWNIFFKK